MMSVIKPKIVSKTLSFIVLLLFGFFALGSSTLKSSQPADPLAVHDGLRDRDIETLSGLNPGFRECFYGLVQSPFNVVMSMSPDGKVNVTTLYTTNHVDDRRGDLKYCLSDLINSARFDPLRGDEGYTFSFRWPLRDSLEVSFLGATPELGDQVKAFSATKLKSCYSESADTSGRFYIWFNPNGTVSKVRPVKLETSPTLTNCVASAIESFTTRLVVPDVKVSMRLRFSEVHNSAYKRGVGYTGAGGSVRVRGYRRKDGTYVRPHTRKRPRRR